ncbi:MAG: hypothetical protein AB1435_16580 [Chloroflexota bacterium]|jgi:hypothetical protein
MTRSVRNRDRPDHRPDEIRPAQRTEHRPRQVARELIGYAVQIGILEPELDDLCDCPECPEDR